jgi:hypothetical protein
MDLKEKKSLTWKQIADFFPGRSSGTLQVRYCTKLKAKATVWSDQMVSPKAFSRFIPHLGHIRAWILWLPYSFFATIPRPMFRG